MLCGAPACLARPGRGGTTAPDIGVSDTDQGQEGVPGTLIWAANENDNGNRKNPTYDKKRKPG